MTDDLHFLARLYNAGFEGADDVPLLIRCEAGCLEHVSTEILAIGGSVRHQLHRVSTVAASVPFSAIGSLAQRADVVALELEQNATIG